MLVDPCRHCGAKTWLDLTEDDVATRLATVQSYEVQTVSRTRRAVSWTIRIGGAVIVAVACIAAISDSPSAIFSGLTSLVGIMAVPFFLLGYGRATKVEARELPYRWALPLPPTTVAAKDGVQARGPAVATSEDRVVAPFSGTACVGYRITVRQANAPSNAAVALCSQQAVDLRVDGIAVHADRTRLDLRVSEVSVTDARQADVRAFLRRHGLMQAHGPWICAEALLLEDDLVVVAQAERGGAILTRA